MKEDGESNSKDTFSFGDKIPFKSPWESDKPKSPLKPDDPIFSNLSIIRNEEYLLRNEIVFDLDAIEDKNRLKASKVNRTEDYFDNWKPSYIIILLLQLIILFG